MPLGSACLLLAALLSRALAQDAAVIEGRVLNSVDYSGIAGAVVNFGPRRAVTDASGGFRFTDLPPGEYATTYEAGGFFKSESKVRLDSGLAAARADIDLVPHSSISGRVLDEQGNPLSDVPVEVTQAIRGSGSTWSVWGDRTGKDGRYRVDAMRPGTYVLRALPRVNRPATYYPSTPERAQAAELVLTGGTQLSGCDVRLTARAAYAIRGTVYDNAGKPVNAVVKLLSRAGPLSETISRVEARGGAFEIPRVPSGDWSLVAEADDQEVRLRGSASALVNGHDLDNVAIHLAAPFAYRAVVEPRGKTDSLHIELYPADAPPDAAYANAPADAQGVVAFPAVYPGRYSVNIYGSVAGHYLDSILFGDQEIIAKEIALSEGMPPLRVIFKPDAATLRGTVENGPGALVVLLPQDEGLWNERFIRRASSDAAGHFEISGLRPGAYYAVALDRVDSTGLDRLSTLRFLAATAARVELEAARVASVELKRSSWPE